MHPLTPQYCAAAYAMGRPKPTRRNWLRRYGACRTTCRWSKPCSDDFSNLHFDNVDDRPHTTSCEASGIARRPACCDKPYRRPVGWRSKQSNEPRRPTHRPESGRLPATWKPSARHGATRRGSNYCSQGSWQSYTASGSATWSSSAGDGLARRAGSLATTRRSTARRHSTPSRTTWSNAASTCTRREGRTTESSRDCSRAGGTPSAHYCKIYSPIPQRRDSLGTPSRDVGRPPSSKCEDPYEDWLDGRAGTHRSRPNTTW